MAFYLHAKYDWLALAPGDDPGDIDIFSEPAISMERTAAFWDIFGALWSTFPKKALDADAPRRHGVVSDVGIGVEYQRVVLASPPAQLVEDLNDKFLANEGTISALQNAMEYISRRYQEDQRQSHDEIAAKQVTIDGMAEQMANKDLAIMSLNSTARIENLRHDEDLSKMHDAMTTKQRVIDELKSELDVSVVERGQQLLELIALRQEVSQLKNFNSGLTSANLTLKAHLDKLSSAVVQMFPGSDDEEDDDDDEEDDDDDEEDDDDDEEDDDEEDGDDDDGDEDEDRRDHHSATPLSPAPQKVSRIPRWTSLLKYPKRSHLTTTSLPPRVIKPDAALVPATMQPDAVASSSPSVSTPRSKFKIRSRDSFSDVPRRRLQLQKTLSSTITSISTSSTSTITSPTPKSKNTVAKARKPFRF